MPYVGEIRWFAGNFVPRDWLLCDGATYSMDREYQMLGFVLGGIWGGDGGTYFNVPNLQGRALVGSGPASLILSQRTLGETGGTAEVVLNSQNVPAHSHAIQVSSNPANNTTPGPSFTYATGAKGVKQYADVTKTTDPYASFSDKVIGANIGAGQMPHSNMMTSLSMMPIICWAGEFPG